MKAFSIIEPYASLIAEGHKLIETRSWKTNYRGRVYIHASATAIPRAYRDLLPMVGGVKPGHIIAAADLVDCVLMTDEWIQGISEDERRVGFYSPGRYGWILENVQPVDPFPIKGHLGLWECDIIPLA